MVLFNSGARRHRSHALSFASCTCMPQAVRNGKKGCSKTAVLKKKTACSSFVKPWLVAIGGWRLAAVGSGWRLVVVAVGIVLTRVDLRRFVHFTAPLAPCNLNDNDCL